MKPNRFRFRAFDSRNKIMRSGFFIRAADGATIQLDEGTDSLRGDENVTEDYALMQSTGLLDSKGKEIFEGDVVANSEDHGGWFWIVSWINGGLVCVYAGIHAQDSNGFAPHTGHKVGHCVIIGNIYENPELVPCVK